jgi:hypothetical protein
MKRFRKRSLGSGAEAVKGAEELKRAVNSFREG